MAKYKVNHNSMKLGKVNRTLHDKWWWCSSWGSLILLIRGVVQVLAVVAAVTTITTDWHVSDPNHVICQITRPETIKMTKWKLEDDSWWEEDSLDFAMSRTKLEAKRLSTWEKITSLDLWWVQSKCFMWKPVGKPAKHLLPKTNSDPRISSSGYLLWCNVMQYIILLRLISIYGTLTE